MGMYNQEVARLNLNDSGQSNYLRMVYSELANAITLLRTASDADNWMKVGEGIKRMDDCRVALKAYIEQTFPK